MIGAEPAQAYHFDPLVAEWFEGRFRSPTDPQREGWKVVGAGQDALISAPTGSGKTLATLHGYRRAAGGG